MDSVDRWLNKHKTRQKQFHSLADMMFDESPIKYPLFRLSLFNFQVIFQFFFHALLFFFMKDFLKKEMFTYVILISAFKVFVSGFWWGGLELLRTEVRYAYRAGDRDRITLAMGCWLTVAVALGLVLLAFSIYIGIVAYDELHRGKNAFGYLFALVMAISLLARIVTSAFHSGIYGISRVIRPHYSIIIGYSLSLALLFILWPVMGFYSILISILGQMIASNFLTIHYTKYMYELYNLWPVKPNKKQFYQFLRSLSLKHFLLAGFSNVFIMSDTALIIAFYYLSSGDEYLYVWLQIVYLVGPLVRSCTDWSRLFYFDRKKLENSHLKLFVEQYDRSVDRVALVIGVVFSLYGILACTVLISASAGGFALALIPYCVLRSLVANLQIKNFCTFHYKEIIVSGLAMTLGLVGLYVWPFALLTKAVCAFFLMVFVFGYLRKFHFEKFTIKEERKLYTNLYSFLSKIKKSEGLVEVYRLNLDENILSSQKMLLLNRLAGELRLEPGHIALAGSFAVLLFREITSNEFLLPDTIFADVSNGMVTSIEQDLVFPKGREEDQQEISDSFFESPILKSVTDNAFGVARMEDSEVESKEQVLAKFSALFPTGVYYDPKKNLGLLAKPLELDSVRKLSNLIWKFMFRQKKSIKCGIDVSVFYADDIVQAVFVIPDRMEIQATSDVIKDWHRYLHAVNIKCATN